MPQGSNASPGWFVKVINEVTKDLKQVAAFTSTMPIAHIQTIRSLFERVRKHNLKLSPSKARLGATDANFLGHSISQRVYARTQKQCPYWSKCRCLRM